MVVHDRQPKGNSERMRALGRTVVNIVGWACIILGVAGALLPILPAWPFLLPGILLLGPRNRNLRLAAARLRLALRQGSRHSHSYVRSASRLLALQERALRRTLSPLIARWADPHAAGPLRYLVLLLPPLAIGFTAFVVLKLVTFVGA
jgi:hypothetical protein